MALALAGVAHWTECWPAKQRVTGSIPSQGTCLACGPGPQLGACERQPHINVSLPLFLPPFPSLSKNKLKSLLKNSNDTINSSSSNDSIIMLILIMMKKKGEREEEKGRLEEEEERPACSTSPHFPDGETEVQGLAAPMRRVPSPCSWLH